MPEVELMPGMSLEPGNWHPSKGESGANAWSSCGCTGKMASSFISTFKLDAISSSIPNRDVIGRLQERLSKLASNKSFVWQGIARPVQGLERQKDDG